MLPLSTRSHPSSPFSCGRLDRLTWSQNLYVPAVFRRFELHVAVAADARNKYTFVGPKVINCPSASKAHNAKRTVNGVDGLEGVKVELVDEGTIERRSDEAAIPVGRDRLSHPDHQIAPITNQPIQHRSYT